MKKIFTLIAMAMVAMSVNAQSQWRPTEEAPAAADVLVNDNLLKVTTVFETTNKKAEMGPEGEKVPVSFTIEEGIYTFEYFTQIRVDQAPSANVLTGTEKEGSTPWVIVANDNVELTVFYRRQQASGACGDNDGKDLKLVDQASPTTAIPSEYFGWVAIEEGNTEYAYALKKLKLTAGKTYTLWARGTTIQCYGIDYTAGTAEDPTALADGTYIISFDGMTAANKITYANGFELQITGNTEKNVSGGSSITVDGKTYTSMKVSNGAENTLTLPEGKVTSGITFYSYVNKDAATDRDSYWKEVAGSAYDAETSGGLFTSFKNGAEPDVRTYSFPAPLSTITFTNSGEQCCYVIKVDIVSGTTGISNVKTAQMISDAVYNLAGQKVNAQYKGVVVKNGRAMIQ